jgi:hypothetical protein
MSPTFPISRARGSENGSSNHLRHHFISEKFWFGVSNPSMDFIGRAYKVATEVKRSATTRKLYG